MKVAFNVQKHKLNGPLICFLITRYGVASDG